MKIDIDYYTFNKMIKFIHFDNDRREEEANYFSITGKYLWKRDQSKFVAMALNDSMEKNFNYDADHLEDLAFGEEITIDEENGVITYKDEGKEKQVQPSNTELRPESLKIITAKQFHSEFRIETEKIVRNLIEMNKIYLSGGENTFRDLIIDLPNQKIIAIGEKTCEKKIEIKRMQGIQVSLRFDYRTMRDLLINAGNFSTELFFRTIHPYVTLIVYNNRLFSAIMHKKESS